MDLIHPFTLPELEIGIAFFGSRTASDGVGESTSISSIEEALACARLIDDDVGTRADTGPDLIGTAIFVALL